MKFWAFNPQGGRNKVLKEVFPGLSLTSHVKTSIFSEKKLFICLFVCFGGGGGRGPGFFCCYFPETAKLVLRKLSDALSQARISYGIIFPNYLERHLELKAMLEIN